MLVLILQSALLLAIAFLLGCFLGWFLRAMTAPETETQTKPAQVVSDVTPVTPKPPAAPAPIKPAEPVALEPAKPAPKPVPTLESEPEPLAPLKAGTEVDNLKMVKGIGPQNEARLNALGVAYFDQVARWIQSDIDEWSARLAFPGRIEREDWVGQAKRLAAGEMTEFSKRVKDGAVASSKGKTTIGDLGKRPTTLLDAPRSGGADKLTRIDGIAAGLEKRLNGIGIYHFDQIAKLTKAQAKWVGFAIGFPGRVEREEWVANAKTLAKSK